MKSDFVVNKYLHTVAFGWILLVLNYDARNHELNNQYVGLKVIRKILTSISDTYTLDVIQT